MKLLRKGIPNKTLVHIFFSMTLAISLTILTLSSVLHFNYESIASSIITSYAKESLRSISYSATFMRTSADNMMKQLFADANIQYLMSNKEPAFPQLSKSLNQLNAYKSSSNFVKSVYVYNRYTDTVYSTLNYGITERAEFADPEIFTFLDSPNDYNMQKPVFRALPRDVDSSAQSGVFTFVLSEVTAQAGTGSAIVLNLSADWLRDIVASLQQNSTPGNILMLDSQKRVIDLSSMQAPQNGPDSACIDTILQSGTPLGSFTLEVNGTRFLAVYDTSHTTDWIFARITPYSFITRQLDSMRRFTLLTGCVILLCGVAVSLLLSRRLYVPFHFMSNKIKTLEAQNWNQAQIVQQDFYRRLLRGATAFSETDFSAVFSADAPFAPDSSIRVALLKIDHFDAFCLRQDPVYRNSYRYALVNMACELSARAGVSATGVNMDDNHVVLLVAGGISCTDLRAVLAEVQQKAQQHLAFSFSVAVSEEGELCHDLALLYTQCRQTIDYRLFYGHGALLFYEELPQTEPALTLYPVKEENQLIELLVQGKPQAAAAVYQSIVATLQSASLSTFRLMILKLLTAIYIVKDTLAQNSFTGSAPDFCPSLDALMERWETLDEMNAHFYALFESIGNSSSLNLRLQKAQKHSAVVARMVQEIEHSYPDKNLSLYSLASLDDMNPVYLGRMFKKAQACSVADYINRVRLQRAAALLLQSEASVADIADSVGFSSSNYFYSIFKKGMGVTPSVYRQCQGKINEQTDFPGQEL